MPSTTLPWLNIEITIIIACVRKIENFDFFLGGGEFSDGFGAVHSDSYEVKILCTRRVICVLYAVNIIWCFNSYSSCCNYWKVFKWKLSTQIVYPDVPRSIFASQSHHCTTEHLSYVLVSFGFLWFSLSGDTIENLQNLVTWNFRLSFLLRKVMVLNSILIHYIVVSFSAYASMLLPANDNHSYTPAVQKWKVKQWKLFSRENVELNFERVDDV